STAMSCSNALSKAVVIHRCGAPFHDLKNHLISPRTTRCFMDFSRSKLTAHSLWLSAALSATFALSACTSDAPNAPERAEARVADALREHPNPAATHALTLQNQVLIANPGANNFDVDSLLTAQGPDLDASTFELAD